MTRVAIACTAAVLLALGLGLSLDAADDGPVLEGDYDGDGIPDAEDNCVYTWNGVPDAPVPPPARSFCLYQMDSDLDGFGDACDTDFNGDFANGIDDCNQVIGAGIYGQPYDPVIDLNCDGAIGLDDVQAVLWGPHGLGSTPGPSGLDCAGSVPCPPVVSW